MSKKFDQQLSKLKADKKKFALLVLLLIAVVMWIAVTIVSSQSRYQLDENVVELSRPIVPYLDSEIFPKLEKKQEYSDDVLENFQIYRITTKERDEMILEIIDDKEVRLATNRAQINYEAGD